MSLVKVKRFAQVTIPAAIRRKAHIEQGDVLDISWEDNRIVITPKRISDKNVDWAHKFDEALGSVRASAKQAGVTAEAIDQAVKTARRHSPFRQRRARPQERGVAGVGIRKICQSQSSRGRDSLFRRG